jgi:hypothetical protein
MELDTLVCYNLINQVNFLREMVSTHPHTIISSDALDYDQPTFFTEPETHFDDIAFQYGQMNRDDSSEDSENIVYHFDTDFDNSDDSDYTEMEMDYEDNIDNRVEFTTTTFTFTVTQTQIQSLQVDNTLVKNENTEIDVNPIPYDSNRFENAQCSICITDFKNNDKVCELNCKHIFHDECIRQWGKYKPECALCRTQIPVKQ